MCIPHNIIRSLHVLGDADFCSVAILAQAILLKLDCSVFQFQERTATFNPGASQQPDALESLAYIEKS